MFDTVQTLSRPSHAATHPDERPLTQPAHHAGSRPRRELPGRPRVRERRLTLHADKIQFMGGEIPNPFSW